METYQPLRLGLLPLPLPLPTTVSSLTPNPDPNPILDPLSLPDPDSDLDTSISDEEPVDHFDWLPDPVLLLILNRIGDVKSLGRCSLISRRFRSLIPLVDQVYVRVDCVIRDDAATASTSANQTRTRGAGIFSHITRAFHSISHFLTPSRKILSTFQSSPSTSDISHHSPDEVLRNFKDLRHLQIVLPDGELGLDDGVLLKWKAGFGSTLETCVVLGASSVSSKPENPNPSSCNKTGEEEAINNAILKLRIIWTISALIAASSRHYLLEKIVSGHETLERLELSDKDGQGVLTMDKGQLEGFRASPISASCGALRTVVPALSVKLWYAPMLDLPGSMRLEGATLVAIRPSGSEDLAGDWVLDAFDEPYQSAVRMLMARRNYRIEMNSF
ncbi:F-box protein [Rhynchospora pubera]|uniref:F-box protein n=1 Tax=Rhynchospora pubera TaxID=906938 RepID=A0AAV8BSV2_9POAL|nr:F-box protein [Rhynchospora pubera]